MIEQLGAKNLKSSGRMMIEKVMIQSGAKSLKNSRGVGGGGSPANDDRTIRGKESIKSKNNGGVGGGGSPPMMIEKVMIQSGAKSPKNSGGAGGGGGSPPTMIEKVMIQLGPKKYKTTSVPLRQGLMVQVRIQSRAN